MKHDPLLGALPIIAKALGRRLGVEVVIGARREASTDGQTIHLPPLPAASAPLAVLANGFIDHEAAHVRYTDFAVAKPAGLAGLLANLLEDIRVERALGAAYPGSRRNLAALVATLESHAPAVPPPEAPVVQQVLGALHYLLRARLLDQTALAAGAAVLEARLDALLPEGVVVKLLALAFAVRHAASTAEVIALAERIVAMLREEAPPPRSPSPPSGDSAGSPPGSADDSAGRPPASSDDPVGSPPSPAGDAVGSHPAPSDDSAGNPPSPADDSAGNPPSSGDPPGAGPPPASGDPAEVGPAGSPTEGAAGTGSPGARSVALAALLAAGEDGDAAGLDVGARARDRLTALAAGHPEARTVLAEYDDPPPARDPAGAVARARAATAQLRRRLGVLVQARRDEDAWRARRGRRLDAGSLYRPSAGQPVRFVRRAARDAPATAVGLLLDRSSSMRGAMALAGQAVLATALALEELTGVTCWVAAFPGAAADRVVPLVGFAERARRVAGRFDLAAAGGTPLATALWRAGYELSQRPEPRRLLVVATDGEPDDVGAAQRIVGRCRAGGIEVIGLGIGQRLAAVRAVFGARDATAIAALAELAPALFALLERRLMAVA
jgi:hypothetical protein